MPSSRPTKPMRSLVVALSEMASRSTWSSGARMAFVDVGIDFGALGTNRAIDVAYSVAVRFEQIDGAAEEHFAVSAFIFGGGVGKVIADVAEIGCTKEGVADGVNEHIGIAVTKESQTVVDAHAAQP